MMEYFIDSLVSDRDKGLCQTAAILQAPYQPQSSHVATLRVYYTKTASPVQCYYPLHKHQTFPKLVTATVMTGLLVDGAGLKGRTVKR